MSFCLSHFPDGVGNLHDQGSLLRNRGTGCFNFGERCWVTIGREVIVGAATSNSDLGSHQCKNDE